MAPAKGESTHYRSKSSSQSRASRNLHKQIQAKDEVWKNKCFLSLSLSLSLVRSRSGSFRKNNLLFFPRTVPYRRIREFPQFQRKLRPRCHYWNLRGRFPPFGFESAELRDEPRQLSRFAFNPWSAPCGCACPSHMPCHVQSGTLIIGAYGLRPEIMAMNCYDMGS